MTLTHHWPPGTTATPPHATGPASLVAQIPAPSLHSTSPTSTSQAHSPPPSSAASPT